MDDAMRKDLEMVAARLNVPGQLLTSLEKSIDRFVSDADPFGYRSLHTSGNRVPEEQVPAIIERIVRREISGLSPDSLDQGLFEGLRRSGLWPPKESSTSA